MEHTDRTGLYIMVIMILFATMRGCGCVADDVQREHKDIVTRLERIEKKLP